MNQTAKETRQPPGLVMFAAIMMFLLGGFQVTWALIEFANAAWLASTVYGTYGGYLWIWGILDVLFALVLFYIGYDLLRGGTFGQVFGLVIVGFSAVRWFFMLPVAPVVAVVIIAIDALIMYGLLMNSDYFSSRATT